MQRAEFSHTYSLPIRWGDMDALGHVNNIEFFRYLESGRIHYMDTLIENENSSEGMVLADIQCAFKRQLLYPGTVDIGTRVARIGNTSLQLVNAIFEQGQEQPAATARAVIVWFDFAEQKPAPVPEAIRQAVAEREILPPEIATLKE